MKEIAVSKFKATCLAVIAEVQRTRKPVRVTRFGKPVRTLPDPGFTSSPGFAPPGYGLAYSGPGGRPRTNEEFHA